MSLPPWVARAALVAVPGAAIALVEAATVLVLRAHDTMDVFAGAVTALAAWFAASALAPVVDGWLTAVFASAGG